MLDDEEIYTGREMVGVISLDLMVVSVVHLELVNQCSCQIMYFYLSLTFHVFKRKGHLAVIRIREYFNREVGAAFLDTVEAAMNPFGVGEFTTRTMGLGT